jgi:uroporphyrinogen-III decarboxylase
VYHSIGGVHGFCSVEDWGLQSSLQMKIDTFREFYKPYYKRIIDTCHQLGMHYFWHNCGYIVDMFPDMIELGVDVLQLDQPRLMGHQYLIDHLGGKICMWNTVDIQWSTAEGVTDDDVRNEVMAMLRTYAPEKHQGGFIAKHYPQPWDINLPVARQQLIYQAFIESGYCNLK